MNMKNKKAIITDYLGWLILAAAVLIIIVIAIAIMKGKGVSIISYIKNIFRFGGR